MSLTTLLEVLLLCFCVGTSSSAQVADDKTLALSASRGPTHSILDLPNRTASLKGSSVNANTIQCDARYGVNPSLNDCHSANFHLLPGSEPVIFGERHSPGLPATAIALPYALFGDKAECFLQMINVGDGLTATATRNQIRSAVNTLMIQCVADTPSTGGIADNIGGDNNLGVILGGYHPRAVCGSVLPSRGSCEGILGDMEASTESRIFGPEGAPGVEISLPVHFISEDDKCILKVYTTGTPDTASWYRIWEAAEATYAVCGKRGTAGYFRGLGQNGNVFITLTSRATGLQANGSQLSKGMRVFTA